MLNTFKREVEGVELAGLYQFRSHLQDYVFSEAQEVEIVERVRKILNAYGGDGPFTPLFTLVRPQPLTQPDVVHVQISRRRADAVVFLGWVELRWVLEEALKSRYLHVHEGETNSVTAPNVVTLRTTVLQPKFRKIIGRLPEEHRKMFMARLDHYEAIEARSPNEFEFNLGVLQEQVSLTVRRMKRLYSSYSFYFD